MCRAKARRYKRGTAILAVAATGKMPVPQESKTYVEDRGFRLLVR